MFKEGYILRVMVKNFVTYSYAEMYPGPNLNMIIGPNGSGKSTIVAAIILGLGGNPKVIGRGTKVSEYVKHDCSSARIEILLKGVRSDIKIVREFNTEDKSIWYFNNEKVAQKVISDCVKQYNIQVNNLCQFLPQDRVQDFAKMNRQDLLKETQIALCRTDLIEKQLALIQKRERHKSLLSLSKKKKEQLQGSINRKQRLEGKVENFLKKKKLLQEQKNIERKIAWVNYENIHLERDQIKADKRKAQEKFDKCKDQAKPIQNAIAKAHAEVNILEKQLVETRNYIKQAESSLKKMFDCVTASTHNINTVKGNASSQMNIFNNMQDSLNNCKMKLIQLNHDKETTIQTYGNSENITKHLGDIQAKIQKISSHLGNLEDRKFRMKNIQREKAYEITSVGREIEQIENIKAQRLQWLRRRDEDLYKATMWLRQNKSIFKGEVFEPMAMEINVLNKEHAIYLENAIPMRERIAFTCVLKEDMNLLIQRVRDHLKLRINVVYSSAHVKFHQFQPKIPIQQLTQYGLYAYMHTLFVGPEPIMSYLCKMYNLHNIPIGNSQTNSNFGVVPREIVVFFSDKFRFSTSYSKYTSSKSTKQSGIRADGSLSISVDSLKLTNLQDRLEELKQFCDKTNQDIQGLDQQMIRLNEANTNMLQSIKSHQEKKQAIQSVDSQIAQMKSNIHKYEEDLEKRPLIKAETNKKIKEILVNLICSQEKLPNIFKVYNDLLTKHELNKIYLNNAKKNIIYLENKAIDITTVLQKAETVLQKIKEEFSIITEKGKTLLSEAKALSNGYTPADSGFEVFREAYNELSDDLEELESEINALISKIDLLSTADSAEMEEYEKLAVDINRFEQILQDSEQEIKEIHDNMERLQEEWLRPLTELVNEINIRFSSAYKKMNCVGEVVIFKGDNEKEYSQYGLNIKVTYRNGQPLQELNRTVQSGGERAVATAIFMLSLQELTPVPFRCVDEINQGMDAINERRIFDLLVNVTSQQDTSQYFLVTPKLLPNLNFPSSAKIHIIFNGPFVMDHEKWRKTQERP